MPKVQEAPPELRELFAEFAQREDFPDKLLELSKIQEAMPQGKYLHWEELKYKQPPEGFDTKQWWLAVKMARVSMYQVTPLYDRAGEKFKFAVPGPMLSMLHQIDKQAAGSIKGSEVLHDPETRDFFLSRAIGEEAIHSSLLEGAATTRKAAKELLRSGRAPRDKNERMVVNNHQAMLFIREIREQELTPGIILNLHRILTKDTLENPDAAGCYRKADDPIRVVDKFTGRDLHVPPRASELERRIEDLCRFANDIETEPFIHPVIRAILLHFWLGFVHPFEDGNGRTARALFYWSMASQKYWLCEFLPISRILRSSPSKYAKAFLYSENDGGDLSYFVIHQLETILKAIEDLHEYLKVKTHSIRKARQRLAYSPKLLSILKSRQLALVSYALDNPTMTFTVKRHQLHHEVTHQTARTDLMKLSELGFLEKSNIGRRFIFDVPDDLESRLIGFENQAGRDNDSG
jgi:Fic family protein